MLRAHHSVRLINCEVAALHYTVATPQRYLVKQEKQQQTTNNMQITNLSEYTTQCRYSSGRLLAELCMIQAQDNRIANVDRSNRYSVRSSRRRALCKIFARKQIAPPWGVVDAVHDKTSAVVLFDLLIVRLLVIGDVVLILLSLMIWHSNCLDKRSRTTQDVHFGFFAITSELPDVEVLHCACVSGGFAVIEVDRSYYPIVQPSRIIGIAKKCTKCLILLCLFEKPQKKAGIFDQQKNNMQHVQWGGA
ncbi:hypothetical protein T01_10381 [Trichinella spiralis]|uniref:Uncharacterized protein n=1 Tax=Trichinella spiralis TaxID=6334 RepID=A0A0V1AQ80_TRISP|nr:hypothetical protein T01_10381 [Trichinella spiralis]